MMLTLKIATIISVNHANKNRFSSKATQKIRELLAFVRMKLEPAGHSDGMT
jgi:hypothetical protein